MAKDTIPFLLIMAIVAITLVLTCGAKPAHAQDVDTATRVFAASAAADWTMTGIGLSRGTIAPGVRFSESTPTLRWAHDDPALTVAAGAAMDVAGVYALRRWLAPTHPRLAAVTLYALAASRVYFVSRSVRILHGDLR